MKTPRYQRLLDIVVGSALLAAALPIFCLLAALVKISSRGSILFRQERLGIGGRPFTVLEFRTMYANTDPAPHQEYFKRYLKGERAPGADGDIFKMRSDPRITRAGRFLRLSGLDELPQLVNVVRGDMALVGPRPPLAYEVAHYQSRHLRRLTVKPGITGLWQVKGRDVVDFETMIAMDIEYVDRQSLLLDVGILLATAPSLARGLRR